MFLAPAIRVQRWYGVASAGRFFSGLRFGGRFLSFVDNGASSLRGLRASYNMGCSKNVDIGVTKAFPER